MLRPPVGVAGDDRVGRVEDGLRRAVVLLERDHPRAGEVVLELGDVADVGAAERVDRLVGIAHHGEVSVLLGQHRQQPELGVVGVLVLVHHDVAEALLPGGAGIGVGLEQEHRLQDHVVEVHRVGGVQPALVEGVHRGDGLLEEVAHLVAVGLRRQEPVLRPRDGGVHRPRREALGVELELLDAGLHEPHLVGLVVDREARPVADPLGVAAEQPPAGRVEGHHPHARGGAPAHEPLHPLLHLVRGPVGERDRQDLARRGDARLDQVRDPVGEHARLARPGPGDDEQRAVGVHDRLALLGVERVEQGVGGGARRGHPTTAGEGRTAIGTALT